MRRQLLGADEVAICRQNRSKRAKGHRLAAYAKEGTASRDARKLEKNFSPIVAVGGVQDVIRQEVTVGARHRLSPASVHSWLKMAPLSAWEGPALRSYVTRLLARDEGGKRQNLL